MQKLPCTLVRGKDERVATSREELVALRWDGWTVKNAKKPPAKKASAKDAPVVKNAQAPTTPTVSTD